MDTELQSKLADALSGRPLPVSILNDATGERRDFEIKQPTFEMLIETSRILSEMQVKDIEALFGMKNIFEFIAVHGAKVLQIIAICFDRKVKYSNDTYNYLSKNMTPAECYDILTNIVLRIGISDFQKSIIAIAPMSLFNQTEIIAAYNSIRSSSQEV
jgi:hypothetical protein